MSPAAPTVQLVNQKQLIEALGISKWMVDDRIARYPKGHPRAFPVEYIGRWRRFDPDKIRAWFAWESDGFPSRRRTPAAA